MSNRFQVANYMYFSEYYVMWGFTLICVHVKQKITLQVVWKFLKILVISNWLWPICCPSQTKALINSSDNFQFSISPQ